MTPTPQAAQSLALWLRAFYPAVYSALAQKALQNRNTIAGMGGFGCACNQSDGFGDVTDAGFDFTAGAATVSPTTVDISTPDASMLDVGAAGPGTASLFDTVDPATFSPVSIESSNILPPIVAPTSSDQGTAAMTPSAAPSVSNSPSVLSSVGNFLASPAGLVATVGLSTAIVANRASQSVLQAQVARVAGGANPAAISYQVNPVTGQVTPVLQTATPGITYPVNQGLLSTLAPNAAGVQISAFLQQYGLWLGLGLLLILIARR